MAALGSPARTLRGLLRELRYLNAATGRPYRDTAAYRYLVKAFRAHRVRKPSQELHIPSGENGLGGRVRKGLGSGRGRGLTNEGRARGPGDERSALGRRRSRPGASHWLVLSLEVGPEGSARRKRGEGPGLEIPASWAFETGGLHVRRQSGQFSEILSRNKHILIKRLGIEAQG